MPGHRPLIFGAILHGAGSHHSNLWRHPEVPNDASVNIDWYTSQARQAEDAGFAFVFIVDSQFIDPGFPAHHLNRLEPISLLSAVAVQTTRIGLIATVSTTYSEPFDIARRIASLDQISGGRAGWNIVTSQDPGTAGNFSRSEHGDYGTRYARAQESVQVVKALWDSYEPGAFTTDSAAERFLDPTKLHRLDHVGEHFSVTGPLNIAASPQGQPVLVQAGTSEDGRELSAAVADIVFTFAPTQEWAVEFNDDLRQRIVSRGRDPENVRFIPALEVEIDGVQRTTPTASDQALDGAYFTLGRAFGGYDFRSHELNDPFPQVADVLGGGENALNQAAAIKARALKDSLTLRQVLEQFQTRTLCAKFRGTPEEVADSILQWHRAGAVDGFNLFINAPEDWEAFRAEVIPLLRQAGAVQEVTPTGTLREQLGLPAHVNRYNG